MMTFHKCLIFLLCSYYCSESCLDCLRLVSVFCWLFCKHLCHICRESPAFRQQSINQMLGQIHWKKIFKNLRLLQAFNKPIQSSHSAGTERLNMLPVSLLVYLPACLHALWVPALIVHDLSLPCRCRYYIMHKNCRENAEFQNSNTLGWQRWISTTARFVVDVHIDHFRGFLTCERGVICMDVVGNDNNINAGINSIDQPQNTT